MRAKHRSSWALIGPDTNFREGLSTWVLIWQRNFNTFEASYHPKWKWKCPRPKEHENLRPWNLWTLGLWDLGIYLFMSYSESNVKLRSDYVVEVEGGRGCEGWLLVWSITSLLVLLLVFRPLHWCGKVRGGGALVLFWPWIMNFDHDHDHNHGPRPGPELDKNNEKYLMKIRKN